MSGRAFPGPSCWPPADAVPRKRAQAAAVPADERGAVLKRRHGFHDFLPGAFGQRRIALLQIHLSDLQVHFGVLDCLVLGINEPLCFGLTARAQGLPFVGLSVETIIGIANATID